MLFVRKSLAYLFLVTLMLASASYAQQGKVIKKATTPKSGLGVQPLSALPFNYENIYIFRIGSTLNAQPTSLVDCTLVGDPNYPNVQQDGNGNCYVQADVNGNFNLTGTYYQDCNADTDIIYFEVDGATVGGFDNSAFTLMAVPTSTENCGYFYNTPSNIVISDFTNVAAAFAVGPFANYSNSPLDGISTQSSNYPALKVAFDAANSLIPIASGFYGGSDTNVESYLNSLADIGTVCNDSTGSTSPGCTSLFSYTAQDLFVTTHAPVDTWQALASIAQDPQSSNNTSQFNLIPPQAAWQPVLTFAPTDWAVPVAGAPSGISLSAASGSKSTSTTPHYITIFGSHLVDATTNPVTYPTVVIDFQNAPVQTGSCSATQCVVKLPTSSAYGVVGVYLEGMVSNLVQFHTTN